MPPSLQIALVLLLVCTHHAAGFRVLGVFPFNGRSHNVMFTAMMEALADRGHEVVMLSPFPLKQPRPNYTDVDLSPALGSVVDAFTFEQAIGVTTLKLPGFIGESWGADLCRSVFASAQFHDVMNGAYGKFDVVFTEVFGSDCWTAVAYKLDLPLISMATQPGFPWMFDRVGGVDNPSYLISGHVPLGGKMTLWERIYNTCMHYAMQYLFKIHVQDPSDDAVREYFGPDTPPIAELVKRTNLLMVNGHVSLNPARPVNPNTIYVSGLHVQERPTRPCEGLEADLCRWMDGADRGVILFTFGSMVRSTTLPAATKRAFKDAFAALGPHYRVLWKYEEADDDMPANVRTATWLPQFHVLAHPKTVLFVTHAGLMGSTEAVALGVPMLALPLFTDQPANAALFTHQGIAEQLHHSELVGAGAADRVLATLRTLVDTDRYRERSREVARRYWDRQLSAADEAVWWTEYVVRHGGAAHLRPAGADLPLHQYLLLDVVAVATGAIIAVTALVWAVLNRVCRPKQPGAAKKPEKTKKA